MRAQLLIYEKGVRTRPTDPSGLDSKRDFSRRLALPPQDYSWDLFHPSCKPTEEALAKNAFLREEVLFRRQEGGDWRFKEVVTYILMCLLLENTEEFTEGGGHLNLQDVQSVSVSFKRQPKQDYLQIGIYGVEGPEAKKPNDVLTALWMIHFIYDCFPVLLQDPRSQGETATKVFEYLKEAVDTFNNFIRKIVSCGERKATLPRLTAAEKELF